MFSVILLTLNEERNLPSFLARIDPDVEVVVLDSGSTDRTVELATAAGASVHTRPFDTFAAQRNHANRILPLRHRWALHLDADERLTPALAAECRGLARSDPTDRDGFFVAPKMLWRGHWLPRCTDYPAYQARFVHVDRFRFVENGHGQREAPDMRMGFLTSCYQHEMAAGGEAAWLEKHRRYAEREALQHLSDLNEALRLGLLVSRDPLQRRRALKRLSYHLPFRPSLRFVYQYLLRRGFLDGGPAFRYCRLLARYESYTQQALIRLRRSQRVSGSRP